MDRAFTQQQERETTQLQQQHQHYQLKLCVPLHKLRSSNNLNSFSLLGTWISKSLRNLYNKACFSNGIALERLEFTGMVVNNIVFCDSPQFFEEEKAAMEGFIEKSNEGVQEIRETFDEVQTFEDFIEGKGRDSSSSSDFLTSETTGLEEQSHISSEEESSSPPSMGWPIQKQLTDYKKTCGATEEGERLHLDDRKLEKQGSSISGINFIFLLHFFNES